MLDRIGDELRAGLQVQLQHDLVLAILNCLGCDVTFDQTTTLGGQRNVDPHSPRDIGVRIAAFYQREGRKEERTGALRAVAQAFECRARRGEPMTGMFFLENARNYYLDAGLRDEAERVQHDPQMMGVGSGKATRAHDCDAGDSDRT